MDRPTDRICAARSGARISLLARRPQSHCDTEFQIARTSPVGGYGLVGRSALGFDEWLGARGRSEGRGISALYHHGENLRYVARAKVTATHPERKDRA